MKDRLLLLIESLYNREGLSKTEFYDRLGIKQNTVSRIRTGRQGFTVDFVMLLVNFEPRINLNWLFKGQGEMFETGLPETKPVILTDLQSTDVVITKYTELSDRIALLDIEAETLRQQREILYRKWSDRIGGLRALE